MLRKAILATISALACLALIWALRFPEKPADTTSPESRIASDPRLNRPRAPRPPAERVQSAISLAAAGASWDREHVRAALAEMSLQEIRDFLADVESRPEALRSGGWLSALDWHVAAEAYLLVFERYAELDFAEAIEVSTSPIPQNTDPPLLHALLRGGARTDGPATMTWVAQATSPYSAPDESFARNEIPDWYATILTSWHSIEPGAPLSWIMEREESWERTAMLCGFIRSLSPDTAWPSRITEIDQLLKSAGSEVADEHMDRLIRMEWSAHWFAADPESAAAWTLEQPDIAPDSSKAELLAKWREISPEQTVGWVEQHRPALGMDAEAFVEWIMTDQLVPFTWAEQASHISDPTLRDHAGKAILDRFPKSLAVQQAIMANSSFSDELREEARSLFNLAESLPHD